MGVIVFALVFAKVQGQKILQINSSECWIVLMHTSDKRPLHSLTTAYCPRILKNLNGKNHYSPSILKNMGDSMFFFPLFLSKQF